MIHTERLSKKYGEVQALADLDLQVQQGEILGFLGPNGAGKSTTVKILTGLIRPTSGRAVVAGFDVVQNPIEVKKRIGYVPETPALYDSLTAEEFLEFVGCLHHLEPALSRNRRSELLELFGLAGEANVRLSTYSKGMRQKVVLAAALIHKPDVLILDEPLDGLDANSAMIVKELLRKMAAQGKTVLFSSHILEVVERMCTRIVIIQHGREVAGGTSAEIVARTGSSSLEEAFSRLTGVRDAGQVTAEFLESLDRA
ncbi:MAG TPA: ABC transporter ATP-binding protein [Candidatus Eisenbacteria bacterium]|nr:ABC transporter ATP-binding protein [Candidatus Eisenbacteria bacterium]